MLASCWPSKEQFIVQPLQDFYSSAKETFMAIRLVGLASDVARHALVE
jgi:hypothetical protein